MLIAFVLTMPNVGSWNGKWSGESNYYARVRKYPLEVGKKIINQRSYYYSWNDGWGANIEAKRVDSKEAQIIRKKSKGFYGYEWMIDSIEKNGKILNSIGE